MENVISSSNSVTTEDFVQYEYMSVKVKNDDKALYGDSYQNLGWQPIEETISYTSVGSVNLRFRRNRNLSRKSELSSLQIQMEQSLANIDSLQRQSSKSAMIAGVAVGGLGTVPLALSTFGILEYLGKIGTNPAFFVPLAAIGLACWGVAYFVSAKIRKSVAQKSIPMIEAEYETLGQICKKAKMLSK